METVSFHGISYSIFKNEPATLNCALAESARKYPDHTALVSPEKQSYTFEKFLEMTDSFAACLEQKWNITKGCVVGLLHYNSVEFCTALLALNKLGAITVPLPGKFRQQEILSLIEKAEISFLICHEDYADWFSGDSRLSGRILVFPENQADSLFLTEGVKTGSALCTDREAPALLMFTSGTTSRSKGVILCNYNFMHAVCSYQKIFHITCCDRTLLAVPIYHITGLAAILGLMLFSGGTVFLHKFFHPEEAAKSMKKERITFFHAFKGTGEGSGPSGYEASCMRKQQYGSGQNRSPASVDAPYGIPDCLRTYGNHKSCHNFSGGCSHKPLYRLFRDSHSRIVMQDRQ